MNCSFKEVSNILCNVNCNPLNKGLPFIHCYRHWVRLLDDSLQSRFLQILQNFSCSAQMMVTIISRMMMVALLVFLQCLYIGLSSHSDPTAEEVLQAYEVKPSPEWLMLARQQNSLRVLCIGGSNTAHGDGNDDSYVEVLGRHLKNGSIVTNEYFNTNSFALNRGSSGFGIGSFIGMKFDFELSDDTSRWPNLVIVDTAVNLPLHFNDTDVTRMFERFLRSMLLKYSLRNVSQPDFLFYNMPHLEKLYRVSPVPPTEQARAEYVKEYPTLPKIFGLDHLIRQFGVYYHLPVISWGNATYAAAMRHFVKSSTGVTPTDGSQWPYSDDGTHMSRPVGVDFGVNRLLVPFLREVMNRKDEGSSKPTDLNLFPRLYPPGPVLWVTASYESYICYGCDELSHLQLIDIVHEGNNNNSSSSQVAAWSKRKIAHSEYCFGSTEGHAVGELRFQVPRECRPGMVDCKVQMTFIHSWNTSYIGHANCTLHKHHHNHHHGNGSFLTSVFVHGQAEAGSRTIPVKSLFPINVTYGLHSVKCMNLVANKLSCMTALEVNAVVIV